MQCKLEGTAHSDILIQFTSPACSLAMFTNRCKQENSTLQRHILNSGTQLIDISSYRHGKVKNLLLFLIILHALDSLPVTCFYEEKNVIYHPLVSQDTLYDQLYSFFPLTLIDI